VVTPRSPPQSNGFLPWLFSPRLLSPRVEYFQFRSYPFFSKWNLALLPFSPFVFFPPGSVCPIPLNVFVPSCPRGDSVFFLSLFYPLPPTQNYRGTLLPRYPALRLINFYFLPVIFPFFWLLHSQYFPFTSFPFILPSTQLLVPGLPQVSGHQKKFLSEFVSSPFSQETLSFKLVILFFLPFSFLFLLPFSARPL